MYSVPWFGFLECAYEVNGDPTGGIMLMKKAAAVLVAGIVLAGVSSCSAPVKEVTPQAASMRWIALAR
jgi:hypothetical protein